MIKLVEEVDLTGFTFIVPSVSVGNVGQLAVDLLICTLELKKLGYIWHSSVLPIAGGDPFGNTNSLSTACEIYYSSALKILVLQIRSAFTKSKGELIESLCGWIKQASIKQVVILTGSSAHERRDQQLVGEPLRYVFSSLIKPDEFNGAVSRRWVQLEQKEQVEENAIPCFIPGSGITMKLFKKCHQELIPCSILIEFCSDGNNTPDALKLADYLDEWLQLREKVSKKSWKYPPSWILLFGPLPPPEIFN